MSLELVSSGQFCSSCDTVPHACQR